MQVASQSMSFKCINNSKLNSNAFKSSTNFFSKLNKDAHDAMLNMIITFGSLLVRLQKDGGMYYEVYESSC